MDAVSPFRAVCGSAAQYSGTRIDHGLSGFCSFSQENKSKPKLSPVMSLDLKEHPMSSNQTLTALSSSSSYVVVPVIQKKKNISFFLFTLNPFSFGFIDS